MGHSQLNKLEYGPFATNKLEDGPFTFRHTMWFTHDGVPDRFPGKQSKAAFGLPQPTRWMRRNGPVLCPSPFPDLIPADFCAYV